MRRVEAIRFVRPMGIGFAQAQLLGADDGNDYVVKFRSNPQGLRVLPNEWVAGGCASALDLPVPDIALVNVSQTLLDNTEELAAFRSTPGLQFGSQFRPHGHTKPWRDVLGKAENLDDLAGILVFDTWVHTKDRSWRSSNVHVIQNPAGHYRVIIFDHGWVFGGTPNWSTESLSQQRDVVTRPFMDGSVYNSFRPHIRGADPFDAWLRKLESFPPEIIWRLLDEVPAEWMVNQNEKEALADYLTHRRQLVRPVILGLKRKFRHWR